MWSFAAVMMGLLALLMSPYFVIIHSGISVDFPRVHSAVPQPNALREDEIRITVTRDGRVYFRNSRVQVDTLAGAIQEAVRAGAERKVYLAVDARAKYMDVPPVLDQIRYAGIQKICVLAEKAAK